MSSAFERPLVAELRHGLNALRGNWFWFVLLGIALIVLGSIALRSVVIASLATAVTIGMLILLGGITETAGAFWCRGWSGFFADFRGSPTCLEEGDAGLSQGPPLATEFAGSLVDRGAFRGGFGTGPVGSEEGVEIGIASEVSDDGSDSADMDPEVLGELVCFQSTAENITASRNDLAISCISLIFLLWAEKRQI